MDIKRFDMSADVSKSAQIYRMLQQQRTAAATQLGAGAQSAQKAEKRGQDKEIEEKKADIKASDIKKPTAQESMAAAKQSGVFQASGAVDPEMKKINDFMKKMQELKIKGGFHPGRTTDKEISLKAKDTDKSRQYKTVILAESLTKDVSLTSQEVEEELVGVTNTGMLQEAIGLTKKKEKDEVSDKVTRELETSRKEELEDKRLLGKAVLNKKEDLKHKRHQSIEEFLAKTKLSNAAINTASEIVNVEIKSPEAIKKYSQLHDVKGTKKIEGPIIRHELKDIAVRNNPLAIIPAGKTEEEELLETALNSEAAILAAGSAESF